MIQRTREGKKKERKDGRKKKRKKGWKEGRRKEGNKERKNPNLTSQSHADNLYHPQVNQSILTTQLTITMVDLLY